MLLFSCSSRTLIIDETNTKYNNCIIRTQKLDFHTEDTIIQTNICIRPNGTFLFGDSLDAKTLLRTVTTERDGEYFIGYIDKFEPKTDTILILNNYLPTLIMHDSSVINHYQHSIGWNFEYYYNMRYSIILANLKYPIIDNSTIGKEIRIILPIDDLDSHSCQSTLYSSIYFKLDNEQGIIYYSEGKYDSLANFILSKKDSCQIKEKHITKIENILQNIDFDLEYYFTEVGLDIHDKYLIEIKMNDTCYVFERGLLNHYNNKKQLRNLYYNLVGLKMKYLE